MTRRGLRLPTEEERLGMITVASVQSMQHGFSPMHPSVLKAVVGATMDMVLNEHGAYGRHGRVAEELSDIHSGLLAAGMSA